MRNIDEKAVAAKTDEVKLESFIAENEAFILKVTSKVCGTYITKSDEQWSIALSSFRITSYNVCYTKLLRLVITIFVSNIATLPIEDINIPMLMGIIPILTLVSLRNNFV